jgi:hypothetical protein
LTGRGATAPAERGATRIAPVIAGLAVALAGWLIWRPPSPDLAGQVYRARLFSTVGFSLWDNAWYGGHYLPGYSLIFPPLASLIGVHWTGVAAVTCSVLLFARIAARLPGFRVRPATILFALSATGDLFIGRVTFALGVTFGLASVLLGLRGSRGSRVGCVLASLACAAASPVAASFLVLASAADVTANRARSRPALVALPAICVVVGLVTLFPEGGYEPFGLTSLLAAGGATAALIFLLGPSDRLLRHLAWLYLASLLLAFAIRSPMGSNAVRFGVLFVPAALAGRVTVADVRRAFARAAGAFARFGRPFAPAFAPVGRALRRPHRGERWSAAAKWAPATGLGLLLAAMVLWQVSGPIDQSVGAGQDPSSHAAFYAPAISYLESRSHGRAMRIEVPFTSTHWDATILARDFLLARGWERQLDTRYDGLFYAPTLTASAYQAWLSDNAVSYVALSTATPDFSSVQEVALIRGGLPFLRLVDRSRNWSIYAVDGTEPLASGPGHLSSIDDDGFTLRADGPGTFVVRVHYTPDWTTTAGVATIGPAAGGWTAVDVRQAGTIAVDAEFHDSLHL